MAKTVPDFSSVPSRRLSGLNLELLPIQFLDLQCIDVNACECSDLR